MTVPNLRQARIRSEGRHVQQRKRLRLQRQPYRATRAEVAEAFGSAPEAHAAAWMRSTQPTAKSAGR
jgi:hypothetical protein